MKATQLGNGKLPLFWISRPFWGHGAMPEGGAAIARLRGKIPSTNFDAQETGTFALGSGSVNGRTGAVR